MNQVLTRQHFKRTRRLATVDRGQGLAIMENARQGAIILEYTGELLTDREAADRRRNTAPGAATYDMKVDMYCIVYVAASLARARVSRP